MKANQQKKYWFYLESYVHISIKGNHILMYNPYNGKILEYCDQPFILKYIKRLLRPDNLRIIPLKQWELDQTEFSPFLKTIKEYYLGDIIVADKSRNKPVQLPPLVKIQKDVTYLKNDDQRSVGENILEYLSNLWIYLNDSCTLSCSLCNSAFRQFPYCTAKTNGKRELDLARLKKLLEQTRSVSSCNFHFLGGNILNYSHWDNVLEIVTSHPANFFYLHYLNAYANIDKCSRLKSCALGLKILLNFPVQLEPLAKVLDTLHNSGIEYTLLFPIRNQQEFASAEEISSHYGTNKSEYYPLFDGSNTEFFQDNLFIDRAEISELRPTLKEIYARGVVNAFNFGHISVLPNGRIFANLNAPALGNIAQDSLYCLMEKELNHGVSWRKIRKHVTPCRSCTFEQLCPPISNTNLVMGKYDLCRIREKWPPV